MKQSSKINFLYAALSALSLSVVGFTAAAQEVITIQQAIENTLKNNLQVKQAQFSESLNDVNLQQSKASLYPSLNASVNQNLGWGRNQVASGLFQNTQNYNLNAGVSTGIDIFNGFSKINQIKQNKALLEAGKTNTEKIKNDLTLSVITSYMQILFNKDFLTAARQQLEVAKQVLNQQQQLLEAGSKTLADVSQSKSQVATAELNVTDAENALSISYLTLAQLMDIPSATVYQVQAPLLESFGQTLAKYNPEEVYQAALKQFPDIRLSSANTRAAELGVEVAKGNLFPRLSLSGSYGTSYFYSENPLINNETFDKQLKDNVSKGIGLSLTIPIFNGLQAKAGVKRATINLMRTRTDEQLTKNNLNKVIYQAVADLRAAESKYESTGNAFAAQKDAFYAIEQRYNVGLANSVEYSTAMTNKNKAEIDRLQAKYDLLFKSKVIDYYLGKQIIF